MKIVYQKCGSPGSLFGAAMGYAGPIESLILRVVVLCGVALLCVEKLTLS